MSARRMCCQLAVGLSIHCCPPQSVNASLRQHFDSPSLKNSLTISIRDRDLTYPVRYEHEPLAISSALPVNLCVGITAGIYQRNKRASGGHLNHPFDLRSEQFANCSVIHPNVYVVWTGNWILLNMRFGTRSQSVRILK